MSPGAHRRRFQRGLAGGGRKGDAQFLNSTGQGNSVHEWSIDADPTGRMMVAVTWSMSADDNLHGDDFGGDEV